MPELADVARVVHYVREQLVGKTITRLNAQHDDNVFGKVGTTAEEFRNSMLNKKIVSAGQQGKYFWLGMSSPPHPVMHLGMTGWLKIKGIDAGYHLGGKDAGDEWPPKFWKFTLEATNGGSKAEAAFVDARRLGRVRLVDCPWEDIRKYTPLKENGPDPVIDRTAVTVEWLQGKLSKKKVPIKALLLDQAQISGLGNWMTDEVLYHAQIHPEQYSNTLVKAQVEALHSAIHHVSSTSVDLLGDASRFPDDWLFPHRWNKGKKDAVNHLPNGDKIEFITVGGRTSCVVPEVQKIGGVASKAAGKKTVGRVKEEEEEDKKPAANSTGRKRKATEDESEEPASKGKTTPKKAKAEPDAPLRRGRSAAKK